MHWQVFETISLCFAKQSKLLGMGSSAIASSRDRVVTTPRDERLCDATGASIGPQ